MRRFLFALAFAGLSVPVVADEARNPAIEGVIQHQFDAFLAEDETAAFSYASPLIQGIFGTAANFGMMVRNGYPMVWHPAEVKYLGLRTVAGRQYQKVAITDDDGALHVLEYEMVPAGDGWVIGGVQVLQQPEIGA